MAILRKAETLGSAPAGRKPYPLAWAENALGVLRSHGALGDPDSYEAEQMMSHGLAFGALYTRHLQSPHPSCETIYRKMVADFGGGGQGYDADSDARQEQAFDAIRKLLGAPGSQVYAAVCAVVVNDDEIAPRRWPDLVAGLSLIARLK